MTVIAMSRMEIDRMRVLRDMAAERITASEAAQLEHVPRFRIRMGFPGLAKRESHRLVSREGVDGAGL